MERERSKCVQRRRQKDAKKHSKIRILMKLYLSLRH